MLDQKRQPVNRGLLLGLVGVAAVVGIGYLATLPSGGLAVSSSGGQPVDVSNLEIAPVQGALAPDFSLLDLNGEQVTLSELRGHPILINLWATWCAPCRIEMPHIQGRFERYADDGLLVLAVDFDEPADQVAAFRDELGLTFDILLDPGGEIQQLYRNRSYPSSFFVDENGVIQVQHIGIMTEGQLDENLAAIGLGG
jgi:peroxiredoxin